ncbi:hypothetical protein DDB_G0280905 [Dictyostelium discoideum AX4]|uniref:Putative uncharacterized protein DDB_G0280905 n=1 Tax=Dictyostelium discoideum TaxID=44689 RepID=Y5247_DICDI|nr:hypothetical protein DDB_G0280905 [Dictyostelium discoideum AX4]Q54UP6.1 RecName: Full=Putative uncharacterized protein DDB_G0280905 [Dictyostelium discoideum]EAL66994.1 hypothetical protein DDB_G0280905 [Dictyostelium discoideum AX4]|eukprot:XP_640975.1 hypothetical protein DDB_G0280905 [Dictyostelium discoideum AX4]
MIIQKILQGAVLDIVQKKLVDKLASNKQFQQMSVQFKDKMDEITGEKPAKRNIHGHNNHTRSSNHPHSGAHSNINHNNNNNINFQNVKYTNDIHENARIYEQQRRLQQNGGGGDSSSSRSSNNNNSTNDNKPQSKNYFTHLFESFKEELNDEADKLNGKKK